MENVSSNIFGLLSELTKLKTEQNVILEAENMSKNLIDYLDRTHQEILALDNGWFRSVSLKVYFPDSLIC